GTPMPGDAVNPISVVMIRPAISTAANDIRPTKPSASPSNTSPAEAKSSVQSVTGIVAAGTRPASKVAMQTHMPMRIITGIGRHATIGNCRITPSVRRKTIIQVTRYSRVIASLQRAGRSKSTAYQGFRYVGKTSNPTRSLTHAAHSRDDGDG